MIGGAAQKAARILGGMGGYYRFNRMNSVNYLVGAGWECKVHQLLQKALGQLVDFKIAAGGAVSLGGEITTYKGQ